MSPSQAPGATPTAVGRRATAITTGATLAALVFAIPAARAADMPFQDLPPPQAELRLSTWTGLYVGLQGGYDSAHDHLVEVVTANGAPTGAVYNYGPDGFVGGGHIGANYQIGSLVLGGIADFEGSTDRGGFVDPTLIGKGHDELPWRGSVRGRLGFSLGSVMAFATGGLAYARHEPTYVFVPTDTAESFSRTLVGWTVGGGLAYALDDHWMVSGEYRYSDYGRVTNVSTVAFPGLSGQHRVRSDSGEVAVSYRF